MSLTGMKKHVGVLEQAGLVTTEKVGRVRTCTLGRRRLEQEAVWIENYRRLWSARFDALDAVVEELKQKEKADERRKRKGPRPDAQQHNGGTHVRTRGRRHTHGERTGTARVRGVDKT